MSNDEAEQPADQPEPVGWRVVDPDGNVVDSGPGMVLEMTTEIAGNDQEEAVNGGD